MVWRPETEAKNFSLFKLWLLLFTILNVIDIIQTWLFLDYEANPLFAFFPGIGFAVKMLWTLLVPSVLYFFYRKNPRFVYSAALALVLLYLAIILVNLFNIMRIIKS
jgi:hypothetical protein